MRILFTSTAGLGHLYMPLARAARDARRTSTHFAYWH